MQVQSLNISTPQSSSTGSATTGVVSLILNIVSFFLGKVMTGGGFLVFIYIVTILCKGLFVFLAFYANGTKLDKDFKRARHAAYASLVLSVISVPVWFLMGFGETCGDQFDNAECNFGATVTLMFSAFLCGAMVMTMVAAHNGNNIMSNFPLHMQANHDPNAAYSYKPFGDSSTPFSPSASSPFGDDGTQGVHHGMHHGMHHGYDVHAAHHAMHTGYDAHSVHHAAHTGLSPYHGHSGPSSEHQFSGGPYGGSD